MDVWSAAIARKVQSLESRNNKHHRVALYFSPSASYVAALAAILRLGRTFVPLDPTLPLHIQHHNLQQTEATILLFSSDDTDPLEAQRLPVSEKFDVQRSHDSSASGPDIDVAADASSSMCILYTSG